ncbi:MAG TPA: endoribonuclease MazF, partial [Bacteroidota bacterium]|nr:endoribonuclease MazF [Bacteroidota bacterium]
MVEKQYIPDRGDIVWLEFNPQSGHEQKGRRPAIVLSPYEYNLKVGLALFCPITSQVKGYPFEVSLPERFPINGVIISDQIKSLDWKVRNAEFIAKA